MNSYYLSVFIVFTLLLAGCGENVATGQVIADFSDSSISSGGSTQLLVSAKNTGSIQFSGRFFIEPQNESVKVSYPGSLQFTLRPGEDTGRRIIDVTGVSSTVRTDYLVTVGIVDGSGRPLDSEKVTLTVKNK